MTTTLDAQRPDTESAITTVEPLLTVQDVAEILQVNPDTVRRYIRDRKLRAVALPGYRAGFRIEPVALRAFLAAWSADATPFADRQAQHLARDARAS